MRARSCREILFVWLAAVSAIPVLAQNSPLTFEGFVDSTILNSQYAGTTFGNAIILTAGITLNEFEFPPHAGANVASDNGGPMTIAFASALRSFGGSFTYSVPLTVQALDSSNNLIASAASAHSNNQGLSGVSGSHSNELLQVASAAGISKIVITGGAQGASFTLDDVTLITRCDLNQDGLTNVTDAQAMVNEALSRASATDDLNADGMVNIVDVQIVLNAALSLGCAAK
jgi:hypothetical protein